MIFLIQPTFAYDKIKIIGIDTAVWNEITIPKDWVYKDCKDSFAEYPDFVEPTIHYCLHFVDSRNHKIELKFSRHKGKLDNYAIKYDMTDYSETYIRIR